MRQKDTAHFILALFLLFALTGALLVIGMWQATVGEWQPTHDVGAQEPPTSTQEGQEKAKGQEEPKGLGLEGKEIAYAVIGALVGALLGSWIGAYLGYRTAIHLDRYRAIEDAASDYIAAVRVLVQALAQEQVFAQRLASHVSPHYHIGRVLVQAMAQQQISGLKWLELIKAVHPYILNLVEAHSKASVAVANPNNELRVKILDLHKLMNTKVVMSADPLTDYNSQIEPSLQNLEDLLRKHRQRGWHRSLWTWT